MKDKKRTYCLTIVLLGVLMLLSGCVRKECEEKVKDLEFTVAKEEELPEALRQQIEEKKEGAFRFTYSDNEYLYVARGYGIQETGGYSIQVQNLYLAQNAIYFEADLIGPENGAEAEKAVSYPYIVVKTERLEENVVFE